MLTNWTGPGSGTTIGTSGSPTFGGPYWNNKFSPTARPETRTSAGVLQGAATARFPERSRNALPYYSTGSGGAPANLYFTGNIGTNTASTLLISITSQQGGGNGIDNLYYYLTNSSGTIISAPIFLFSSAASQIRRVAMSIPAGDGYGFELTNGTVGASNPNTYLMNDTGGGEH